MLKKALVVLSITTAFALVLATPPSALAKDHHKKQQVHKNVVVKKNVHVRKNVYVVGKKYHGHVWYGHRRHRWHGKWYDYGIGPCWINVGGLWFWNVAACP